MNGRKRATSGLMVAIVAVLAMLVGVSPALATATPPSDSPRVEGKRVCGKTESTPVAGGRYEAQNNLWGADTPQCITAFDTGFVVDPAEHVNTTGPAGYPSIYRGCVYGYCTGGSPFPRRVDQLGTVTSSWSTSGPTDPASTYNTAYDLWFDPNANQPGRNTGAELMVWLNTTGVQPIGTKGPTVTIAGASWDVWQGTLDGLPVISYVRTVGTTSVTNLPLHSFVADATTRGVVEPGWYLTSVQAGFEPWTGGAGLRPSVREAVRQL